MIFLPALFMCGYFASEAVAAALGLVFILGRALYARGYVLDPAKRGPGFLLTIAANLLAPARGNRRGPSRFRMTPDAESPRRRRGGGSHDGPQGTAAPKNAPIRRETYILLRPSGTAADRAAISADARQGLHHDGNEQGSNEGNRDDEEREATRLGEGSRSAVPSGSGPLVRRFGGRVRRDDRADARQRHGEQARREQAPEQLPGPVGSRRRRARRGPHLHLLARPKKKPARPTTGPTPPR